MKERLSWPDVSRGLSIIGVLILHVGMAVPYGTEASHFEASGSSTVVIGPGSIDQAHQPNEFVEIVELEKCLGFLERVVDWAETPDAAA